MYCPKISTYGRQNPNSLITSKLLGAPSSYVPTSLRIHVILQRGEQPKENQLGYSLPLCGFDEQENEKEKPFQVQGKQINFFANY